MTGITKRINNIPQNTKKKKFVVITSIFAPTKAVRAFAKKSDWQLVVVGDKKTPATWNVPDVKYLSPSGQAEIAAAFSSAIPWNNYCRKMIGYVYAMRQNAEIIADSDDDNIPYESWGKEVLFQGKFPVISKPGFHNLYQYYTDLPVWPRGFPLPEILANKPVKRSEKKVSVGIWQELADGDPDVDAIYRLTNNTPIMFKKNGRIVLDTDAICPINSQNTFFRQELFPLLYLPAFVNFRFTDILRGLVAQPILWINGYRLGFGEGTVFQKRNPHDYLKDFESEIPAYLHAGTVSDIVKQAIRKEKGIEENMLLAYQALQKASIVEKEEVSLLKLWLKTIIS